MCVTLNHHVYETLNPSSVGHVSFFLFACFQQSQWVGVGGGGASKSLTETGSIM